MTSRRKLSTLGEFGYLQKLLPRLYWPPATRPQLCIGPGDDAGVLRISSKKVLVATTDAMTEGVHFDRKWFSWRDLGWKVLAVNLSDLAAMGEVKPLAALVTAALPGDTPVHSVDKFYSGLDNCAQRWKTGFLGGDTVGSRKGWFVSVSLFGEADPRHLIRRSGARAGDLLVVTGFPGQAAAGLEVLQRKKMAWTWTRPLRQAFRHPQPRLAAGALLGRNQWASSLMDTSDGLEASVRLIAAASKVGARIDLESLPVSASLARWAAHARRPAWRYALSGGEDYELVFTVPPRKWPQVAKHLPEARVVGRIVAPREGIRAVGIGRTIALRSYGYSHF